MSKGTEVRGKKEKRKGKSSSSSQRQTYLRLINGSLYRIGEHIAFEGGNSNDEFVQGLVKKINKWQRTLRGESEVTPDVVMNEADKSHIEEQGVVTDADA